MSLLDDNIAQANEIERLTRSLRELEKRVRNKPIAAVAFLDEKISQMEKSVGGYAKREFMHLKAIREYISSL